MECKISVGMQSFEVLENQISIDYSFHVKLDWIAFWFWLILVTKWSSTKHQLWMYICMLTMNWRQNEKVTSVSIYFSAKYKAFQCLVSSSPILSNKSFPLIFSVSELCFVWPMDPVMKFIIWWWQDSYWFLHLYLLSGLSKSRIWGLVRN